MKKNRSRPSRATNDEKQSPQSEKVRLAGEKYVAAKVQVKQAKLNLKQARIAAKELKRLLKSAVKELKRFLKDASRDQKKMAGRKGKAGQKATGKKAAAPARSAAGNTGPRTGIKIPSATPLTPKIVKPKRARSKPGPVVSSKVRKAAGSAGKIPSTVTIVQANEPPEAAKISTFPGGPADQAGEGQ